MTFKFLRNITVIRRLSGFAAAFSLLIINPAFCLDSRAREGSGMKVKRVLDTEENIIGQKIVYPAGAARITSEIIEVPPKSAIPWHEHLVPMYAYVLKGEIEVDYGDKGIKRIKNGAAMIEAVNFPHKGLNKKNKPAQVLVVYVGATGSELEKVIDKK